MRNKSRLKIAFFVYPTAFQSPGGGEVQLLKTKEYLVRLGVEVKLFDIWTDKLKDFDILHVFGSVKDCLGMMQTAHALGVKTVLSTICWYSWKSSLGIDAGLKEKALSLLRHSVKSFLPFIPSQRKSMMRYSDLLCPNSESEAVQLQRYFGVPRSKIAVVPNGVDRDYCEATPDAFIQKFGFKDFVLCVGRIEPRKNQLNMIRALRNTDIPFVLIGDYVHQYRPYYLKCREEATENIHFLGALPNGSGLLASAYAACDTFLLASWLETPGIAALEAGLAGAKIVITNQGATREYFQDYVRYADPADSTDILAKVQQECKKPKTDLLRKHILRNYLWEVVARKTLEGYTSLLQKTPI